MDLGPLVEALSWNRPGRCAIRAWSIYGVASRRLSLGTKDRETGNAHAPLGLAEGLAASYRIVWGDGLVSRGSLERRQVERDLDQALSDARAAAIDDPDSARVLGPGIFPEVALQDTAAAAVASGDLGPFAERLAFVREAVARDGFKTWSGSFSASEAEGRLVTSAGLDVAATGTGAGWSCTLDGELGGGFASRALEPLDSFQERLERLVRLAVRLREPGIPPEPGVRSVLLHPDVVEEFVLGTLLHNLEGATVAHGEGAFRRGQFGSGEPVLREDLTLRVDPLRPLRSGSYRFSPEGVPAASATFIERGRLATPMLDLKYAARLGLPPTPLPYAMDTLELEGPTPLEFDAAVGAAGEGALVLTVLGVHTQDAASGDFSLASPQSLTIAGGRLGGKIRATISGNLFDLLRSRDLAFVAFDGETTPGLLLRCRLDPR